MPEGTVQAIGKSRSGKPIVTVDGQVYSASKVDLSGLQIGARIEMDTASSVYNGATIWFLNGYKVLHGSQPTPATYQPPGQNSSTVPSVAPQGAITEGERLTISNWVAAAIQAGKISDPAEMGAWAHAACDAIRSAGKFTQEEMDDKIPF